MAKYILNNFNMIKIYSDLYTEGMDIEMIKKKIFNGEFDNISLNDLYRFRIFLDSSMLLFNKEKLEKNMKRAFSYKEFMTYLVNESRNKEEYNAYVECVNKAFNLNINIQEAESFYFPNPLEEYLSNLVF